MVTAPSHPPVESLVPLPEKVRETLGEIYRQLSLTRRLLALSERVHISKPEAVRGGEFQHGKRELAAIETEVQLHVTNGARSVRDLSHSQFDREIRLDRIDGFVGARLLRRAGTALRGLLSRKREDVAQCAGSKNSWSQLGGIDPRTRSGKWYLGTMLAGTVSGFGFILTLGFTPGQVLGLFTLALLLLGTLTLDGRRRGPGFTQTATLTTSFLMLWVFFTTETLKRLPLGQPFATGPADPALIPVRLALLVAYLAVLGRQLWRLRADRVFDARVARFLAVSRVA